MYINSKSTSNKSVNKQILTNDKRVVYDRI